MDAFIEAVETTPIIDHRESSTPNHIFPIRTSIELRDVFQYFETPGTCSMT